ncbi:MAG TPA: ABC transporter permease [Candidatus Acidoferrales bacterium]|nr:ABC transporter permease [Candidatus Acidoferrales bacterium]
MATLTSNTPARSKLSPLSLLNRALKQPIQALQEYSVLVGDSIVKACSPPIYFSDVLEQMDVIGVGSLPIIVLTGFFIGGVMVQNTAAQFQQFGSPALIANVTSIALIRELGPFIAALLITGRNGSGIASELGSMVVTEQVDAMRALGTDPIRKLVVPRVLATLIVLPLLTAVTDLVGLIGGYIVASYQLSITGVEFWNRAITALASGDLIQGIVKPLVFAIIISTIGCFYGLRTHGGTQGVGRATTSAVVAGSITVIVVDFFLGKLLLYYFVS